LDQAIDLKDGDELVRCITPNEQEDFLLLNKPDRMIRTFVNSAARNSNKMVVTRGRKIRIVESTPGDATQVTKLGSDAFHSAVGSKENDYLLFFTKFDMFKLKIDVQEQIGKEKKSGVTHACKEIV
jgi:hypothetical protein